MIFLVETSALPVGSRAHVAANRERHFGRSWASFDQSEKSGGKSACVSQRSRERPYVISVPLPR